MKGRSNIYSLQSLVLAFIFHLHVGNQNMVNGLPKESLNVILGRSRPEAIEQRSPGQQISW